MPAKGGIAEPMPLPRGYQGKISPDGRRIAYRMNNSWDEERRNYRGGQNRPVWIVDLKSFDLVSPPWTDSKDVDPAWLGDTVYFISDRDGIANVWSYDTATKALTQRTKFIDYDVKSLDAGGGAVVFEQAGYLHVFDPKANKTEQLTINAAGDFPWMMTRFEDVTTRMSNISLSPTGKRVLVEARGEIFTIPEEKGDVRNITNSSGSAERQPAWSPDGKWISYFSDKSGEYKLVIESQDGVGAAARDRVPEGGVLLHAGVVAGFEEAALHRHQPERVGDGHRDRAGEDDRQRSVDGAAAHAGAVVESRLEVGRVRIAPQHAVSHDRRRRTSRPARSSRSPTASPMRCTRCGTRAASICGSSPPPISASRRSGST